MYEYIFKNGHIFVFENNATEIIFIYLGLATMINMWSLSIYDRGLNILVSMAGVSKSCLKALLASSLL